jgi:alpha-1,3-mannosyltransferase
LKKELTKKVSKLGLSDRIKIIGEVSEEELHKIYSKAEYFVSASKYEGFGITAIEAMHYNCVTILNDIPTFRDFASHKRGYIIDFESEKATNQIEEIKKKNNTEVINKAKKYSTEFLWKNKISEFIALYKKI